MKLALVALAVCAVVACLALPLVAVAAVTGAVTTAPAPGPAPAAPNGMAGTAPVTGDVRGIPAAYMAAFRSAQARYGVPWDVLAGIYEVECDFGQSPLAGCRPGTANPFGAQGPGQFLPPTWRRGLPPSALIAPGPPAPPGDGFATDGDDDGVADVWDPADAVASTARMLAADGAPGDLAGAVFAYDHSPTYVATVLALASAYADGVPGPATVGAVPAAGSAAGRTARAAVATVLDFARAQLGAPYRWGGSGPGGWDCSGLVQAAYAAAGLVLTHDAAAQYRETERAAVPLSALRPGDLVFYGSSPATIHHVGIVIGGTVMIDAPHTGAVVRVDPVAAPDLLAATRPVAMR